MAKSVDAGDLKSPGHKPCRFESGSGHQKAVWTHPIQSEKPKETRVMAGFFVRQRPKAAY